MSLSLGLGLALTRNKGGWPADMTHDIDFVRCRYRYARRSYAAVTDLPGTTFTRATEALNADGAGQWYAFASGALRVTSAGCFFGENTTNKCTNYNAAPTDLTNVSKSGDAAATLTVVDDTAALRAAGFGALIDAGKMNGKVYKLDNSAGSTSAFARPGGLTGNTNTHSCSAFVRGTGSGQVRLSGAGDVDTPFTAAYIRRSAASAPPDGTRDLLVRAAAGAVVYFILNQLEEKTYATNPVIVAGASATRNTDVLASANDPNPAAYTVVAEFTVPLTGPAYGHVWGYDDGTAGTRAFLFFDRAGGKLWLGVKVGGVDQAALDLGAATPGQSYKVAFAVAANDFAAIMTGKTLQTDASGTVPTTTAFRIGCNYLGTENWGGYIRRVQRYAVRKTNAELQALVA